MDHAEHMQHTGGVAHEEVVDGVKATFKLMDMANHMKSMGIKMPTEMKETHHLAVEFKDARTGKPLEQGEIVIKVRGPGKSEQTKSLTAMAGHFGTDLDLSEKGKYGIACKFKLADGKPRQVRFWYETKP